jgi:Tol biopolymer transport system component
MEALFDEGLAYLARWADGRYAAVVDGVEGPAHPGAQLPLFSPDSQRVAYSVREADGKHMVVDGVAGPAYLQVWTPLFSPDSKRMAYVADNAEDSSALIVDGRAGAVYQSIECFDAVFSPDSKHVVYQAQKAENAWTVVLDGVEGPVFDELLSDSVWREDGTVVYFAVRGGKLYRVVQ